ncbi:G-type lectin S-receptor-like serine/threonine-protein kinase RKS1 isoform X6 [Prunus avium]|uniref:Receptor-like serine/threonine-protein kinase n=1 Tax=Prunus avium TaxID=42229 RepID=A0A6P5RWX1_PRUAV|nr:G-type lectin S-receptor-like serine/threonine-protein kinase RKS1 isoform X6 [Prunus avium]
MNYTTRWFSMNTILVMLIFLVVILPPSTTITIGSIKPNQPMRDGDVLLSSTKIFALGFFSPPNSRNRYVGVWYYKIPNQTIVWVANRDHPIIPVTDNINDASGIGLVAVHRDGGLVIYDGKDQNTPRWSANVSASSSPNNSMTLTAKLLDTGNLVLLEEDNGVSPRVLWQGFDYPSNTILPSMKIGLNRRSGLNRFLTSWKSPDDPGTGNYTYGIDSSSLPQLIVYKDGAPLWRKGSWLGQRWGGYHYDPAFRGIFNSSFENNPDETSIMNIVNDPTYSLSRTTLLESGILVSMLWNDRQNHWLTIWSDKAGEQCEKNYGNCGPNGNCDPSHSEDFQCGCLPGFEIKSEYEWRYFNGSGGCVRKRGTSTCGNREGFVKVERVKIPDSSSARVNMSLSFKACKKECSRDCSCMAYTGENKAKGGIGCVTWHGDLMDTRTYSDLGLDLYVRVDAITLGEYAKKSNSSLSKKGKIAISLLAPVLLLVVFFWYCTVRRKKKGKQRQHKFALRLATGSAYLEDSSVDVDEIDESRINSDLPFFDLPTITAATNNFSVENKLGKGGFGSVYKGVLYNGKEVAVKRLSKHSGQGVEEFKNEVVLIAKLQHRNLVRILGCCIQDEEKMLIYEYLPNKSLDFFIFNETNKALLDWTRRFEIICGIARGVLYLHQDSRLRIIHRDLKASNILLDSAMNPKIADFGLARIFGRDQNEASTNRVVGTYGYMSPEYAMEGLFSVKSDVYSFGILLLEIVSGRKNTGYYHDNPDSNLVGHVWDLWKEGRASEIIDSTLGESYPVDEVVRCIQIALLCVQEHATNRPTMSGVVSLLGNNAAAPSPRQPGFLVKRSYHTSGDPSASTEGAYSVNDVTCTEIEAR